MTDHATIASNIRDRFATACGEIAYEKPWKDRFNANAIAWHKTAVANGVRDLEGAYADVLFNDPDTARDFIGDWVYDECHNNKALRSQVIESLSKQLAHFPESLWKELLS